MTSFHRVLQFSAKLAPATIQVPRLARDVDLDTLQGKEQGLLDLLAAYRVTSAVGTKEQAVQGTIGWLVVYLPL